MTEQDSHLSTFARLFIAAAILSATTSGLPGNAVGQRLTVSSCAAACPLSVRFVTALGDTTGGAEGFLGNPNSIARLANGGYLVVDRHDQDRLKRFSPRGEYLGHVGRHGQGPGEFQTLQFVTVLAGDTVETFDLSQRRVTVFDPSWRPVRTTNLHTTAWEMARLDDGSRVIAGYRFEPDRTGIPLHHFAADGQILQSFGAESGPIDMRKHHVFYRQLTRGSCARCVWSAHLPRYQLAEWGLDGKLVRSLERNVEWFPGTERAGYTDAATPPAPGIQAIHLDSDGILWVLIHVADAQWKAGLGPVKDPYGRTYTGIADYDRYFDSIIEAIDPAAARVVGSGRFDQAIRGFTQDGHLFGYAIARSGEPFIPIWSVSLSEEGRGRVRPQ